MSHPVRSTRDTSPTNPLTTTTNSPRIPTILRGVANAPSTLNSATEPESASCFSQIWATVSSLTASILSWISSLWNWIIGEVATPQRTSAQIANILIEKVQRFFNETVVPTIPSKYPRKIACLLSVGEQRVAVCIQDLESNPRQEANSPIQGFARGAIRVLDEILRERVSLNENTEIKLNLVDFHSAPEAIGHPELSGTWRTSAAVCSVNSYADISGSPFSQYTVEQIISDTGVRRDGCIIPWASNEQVLLATLLNFFNDSNNSSLLASWTYATPQA